MAGNKRIDNDTRPVLTTLESSYKLLVDNSSVGTKMLDLSVVKNVDNHVDGTTNKVFTATEKNKLADLATVAETGSYNDLLNLPTLFSGSYNDLTNVPIEFTPEAHTHTLSEVTDSGTAASKDYWTGTQAEFDSNTVKDGIGAQSADIAIIIG